MIKKYIKRNSYIKRIKPFIDKEVIKVITGQRRVGKSYLLFQIMDEVKKLNPKANIIYINKELYEFDSIKTYHDLLNFLETKLTKRGKNYVFVDEIQDINGFEKALRHLQARGKCDIYCTGSNAELLSGELATYLSGRFIEIQVHNLSYNEFLMFHKKKSSKDSLLDYIKYGGMPYLIHLPLNDEIVYDYLRTIYNTIVLKDVVSRFGVRNVNLLERLTEYIADNAGSLVSAKKISDFLKSQNIDISPNTMLNYLSYLSASFFIYKVSRMDVQGKKIFEVSEKYYFEDLGLRHALIGYKQVDINKILENLVFSQLKCWGYTLHVGQYGRQEIDFVAEKGGARVYVQVVYLISSRKVQKREFGNLLMIDDNYPKIVVSMDEFSQGVYKGIQHIHVMDFLTNNPAW